MFYPEAIHNCIAMPKRAIMRATGAEEKVVGGATEDELVEIIRASPQREAEPVGESDGELLVSLARDAVNHNCAECRHHPPEQTQLRRASADLLLRLERNRRDRMIPDLMSAKDYGLWILGEDVELTTRDLYTSPPQLPDAQQERDHRAMEKIAAKIQRERDTYHEKYAAAVISKSDAGWGFSYGRLDFAKEIAAILSPEGDEE